MALKPIKGVALSAWATYLVNGDDSGIDPEDRAMADRFAEWMGGPIVSCDDAGFRWTHDASQFGALAGDCQEYTALIESEG